MKTARSSGPLSTRSTSGCGEPSGPRAARCAHRPNAGPPRSPSWPAGRSAPTPADPRSRSRSASTTSRHGPVRAASTRPASAPSAPETARRLACDANVVRVVTGGASEPLDVGRASRTVSPAQRRALTIRDRGCVFPGCDRPPGWCDGHHIVHWADGGPTDLANLALLCHHHHKAMHEGGWTHGPRPRRQPGVHPTRRHAPARGQRLAS